MIETYNCKVIMVIDYLSFMVNSTDNIEQLDKIEMVTISKGPA